MSLPCMGDRCRGTACGNFNDPESKFGNPNLPRGCKGGKFPPWSWAKWYLEELPKIAAAKYAEAGFGITITESKNEGR